MRAAIVLVGLLAASSMASAANVEIKSIVDPYVRIQRALSADSLKGVQGNAQRIAAEAAQLGSAGDAVESAAVEMAHSANLTAARAAFGRLGDAIIVAAKDSNTNLGDGVKVAYCPMLRKYWLQKGDDVQNPFYGKAMSGCGRINPDLPDLKK